MSWFSNIIGDVTNAVEDVVPGAKNIDQFLNKAGVGPQELAHPFQSPQGWAGDLEHGFSQVTHNPYVRSAEELAAAVAAAYLGQEYLVPYLTDAAMATTATDAAVSAEDLAAMSADAGATLDAGTQAAIAANTADIAAGTAGSAATGATAAGAAGATAADTAGMLPEVTVSAPAYASGAPLTGQISYSSIAPQLLAAAPAAAQAAAAQQGPRAQSKEAAQSYGTDTNLAPAAATPDLLANTPLAEGDLLSQIGTSTLSPDLVPPPAFDPLSSDAAMLQSVDPEMMQAFDPASGSLGGPSWLQSLGNYATSGKGMVTEGLLGMSLLNALKQPKLPGAAQQAGNLAGPAAAQAQGVISSGGYSAPQWGQQKASIDAMVDQEISDASKAMQQNAANAGMGGTNSDVVQQQIASIKDRANTQRQMLYAQALQQNINNAVSELTGADQTLMGIANMQYQQSDQAKALAAQLAEMAGYLNIVSGPSVPA